MKIKISNAGHLKEAVIEEKQLTVIVGDNGTGKTLLLEALAFTKKRIAEELSESIKKAYEQFEPYFRTDFELESHQVFREEEHQDENTEITANNMLATIENEEAEKLNEFFADEFKEIIYKIEREIGEKILFNKNSVVKIELLDILQLAGLSTVNVAMEPDFSSSAFLITLPNSSKVAIKKRISKISLVNQETIQQFKKINLEILKIGKLMKKN